MESNIEVMTITRRVAGELGELGNINNHFYVNSLHISFLFRNFAEIITEIKKGLWQRKL